MTDRDRTGASTKEATCGPAPNTTGTGWLVPLSLVLTAVVAVNAYIVWYLMVAIPQGCADLAIESNGRATCGIEPGAYILSGISIAIIVVAIFAFAWWNLARCRNCRED